MRVGLSIYHCTLPAKKGIFKVRVCIMLLLTEVE